MYRENKYGEKVDVNKYECGFCKYYFIARYYSMVCWVESEVV